MENETKRFSGRQVAAIALLSVLATLAVGGVLLYFNVFVSEFKPVMLSAKENEQLEAKLAALDASVPPRDRTAVSANEFDERTGALKPERYSEEGAVRAVSFTERELNALLAHNTDLARRLAIDLSADLASAKLLVPLDPEFPLFGGKTLKLTAGLELRYANGRPIVVLRGVSVWGVPMPNAWIGGLKNVDLVGEFGGNAGFWQAFADGIETIEVRDGELNITLKE